jgi:hypothetical protein
MAAPVIIDSDYWESFQVCDADLSFINNHLFELETPQTTEEILLALIDDRIKREKSASLKKQEATGKVYLPEASYSLQDNLIFPALNWMDGKVLSVRSGHNPEVGSFQVIDVKMASGEQKSFAAQLVDHRLNHPENAGPEPDSMQASQVIQTYCDSLTTKLDEALFTDPDLAFVTGAWFPRALFVDINTGQLNLAEAVLDMAGGGAITTLTLME